MDLDSLPKEEVEGWEQTKRGVWWLGLPWVPWIPWLSRVEAEGPSRALSFVDPPPDLRRRTAGGGARSCR